MKRLMALFFISLMPVSLKMVRVITTLVFMLLVISGCKEKSKPMSHKYTNALIEESSPYLLQHAHNPVNWEAWNPDVLERAQRENKLLLVSIGYAACHWCHVMEAECFEDEEVAKIMNERFINIKVDREERPDVDQIYMDALQMMTGGGGWPLNIVALPDGRPFWGATYVKKDEWKQVLKELHQLYISSPDKVREYAGKMEEGIKAINLVESKPEKEVLSTEDLQRIMDNWRSYFDTAMGGYSRAPKFMMPGNLDYFLHYATINNDKKLLEYVNTSLTKMAYGGIYDQLGGGFSRYSTDIKWHVPHFEKMLYDNGQLISLYAKAYAATGNDHYRKVVGSTVKFVTSELMDGNGGFYSSLDADSENDKGVLEEGAYYVWGIDELQQLPKATLELFKDYYNINSYGLWEDGKYVLIRKDSDIEFARKHKITAAQLNSHLEEATKILLEKRALRPRPRLDDKMLTSWNGLMLSGLVDAYRYIGDEDYLRLAINNGRFITENLIGKDGNMFHSYKNWKRSIPGYLEDYALVAEAFLGLYEVSQDESWLKASRRLLDYCISNFRDTGSGLFYFTSLKEEFLIRRTLETVDNVIPSSNSVMAKTLWKMSRYYPDAGYAAIAEQMLYTMQHNFYENASNHANWQHLALYLQHPFYEIAVVGDQHQEIVRKLLPAYLPNTIIAASEKNGDLPLLQGRYAEGITQIYVCQEGSCKLPVSDPALALSQLR